MVGLIAGTRRLASTQLLAVGVIALTLTLVYLRWTPLAPDLAAQVARADVTRKVGNSSWWTGWFGGLSMPTYSVLVPAWMGTIGVRATGVVATVVGAAGCRSLVRDALRPRASAWAFAVSGAGKLDFG